MKKLFVILISIMMFLPIMIMAQEEPQGNLHDGSPFIDIPKRTLTFTVVNDKVCSVYPDYANSKQWDRDEICWNNAKTDEPAVVFQVFHLPCASCKYDYKVGEVTVEGDDRKCIDIPKVGDYYYYQAFYCNQDQVACKETYPFYTAGCDYDKCDEGEVLRVRGLTENTAGGCSGWSTEACISDDGTGFNCDGEGSSQSADSGNDGAGTTPSTKDLNGEWQNVGIPETAKPGSYVTMTSRFEAFVDGKYYLEAGISPQQFSIVAEGSLCDGNKHFAGKFVDMKAGDVVDMEFRVLAYEEERDYQVLLGAYTGCLAEGGKKINTLTKNIQISDSPTKTVGSSTKAILSGSVLGISVVVILLILAIIGVIIWMRK